MTAPIKPGTVAGLSPEELFGGDATEILSVRGREHFHCLVVKQGRGLVYYAYPERFPGDSSSGARPPNPCQHGKARRHRRPWLVPANGCWAKR